ncbi:MAG: hypothetical protein KKA42_03725 [candidate division Zixibacteria bacterium]|nr:hypothetical protein [candidate division Zixibacteria bacterium]
MVRKLVLLLAVSSLMVWGIGCSDSPSQPDQADNPNYVDDFGGYTPTDEAPGFGDPDLIDSENDEEPVTDVLLSSPEVASLIDDPMSGRFHLRVIWGQLRYDSSVTTPTDWTGSLSVTRGALLTTRLIAWELNQDFLLPRTERTLIEWQSTTTVHHDGLAFDLFVPAPELMIDTLIVVDTLGDTSFVYDTLDVEPVVVTFETGPYTRSFTLGELAALNEVVYVDDVDSNAVAFYGLQMYPNDCRKGMLAGHWGYDENGDGVFVGRWHSQHGALAGYVEGHWGVDDNGDRVFFGKWISRTGRFEGLLKGTWRANPSVDNSNGTDNGTGHAYGHSGGKFEGRIYDADQNPIGALKGNFRSNPHFPDGWFQGRWKLDCNIEPAVDAEYSKLNDGF